MCLTLICACRFAVIDVQAFERLLGPCMEIMKRSIAHYEEQLVALFGSSMDLRDWQRLAVPYTPHIRTPQTCTHKQLNNLIHIVYINKSQFVGTHSFFFVVQLLTQKTQRETFFLSSVFLAPSDPPCWSQQAPLLTLSLSDSVLHTLTHHISLNVSSLVLNGSITCPRAVTLNQLQTRTAVRTPKHICTHASTYFHTPNATNKCSQGPIPSRGHTLKRK